MKLRFPFGSNQDSYTSRCFLLLSEKYIWLCIFWFPYETLIAHCTEGLIDVACDHCYLHIFHSSNTSLHNPWVCVYCRIQGEPFQPEGASSECHSASFCHIQRAPFSSSLRTYQNWHRVRRFSRIMERELAGTSKLEIDKIAAAPFMWPSKWFYPCGMVLRTLLSSLVSNWGVHRVSVWTASPQQWPQQWSETAHPPFWSSVCWQTRLLSREYICSHLLTEGPLLESAIYFRETAADSFWMAAESWNPAQIFICFTIIKRFHLRRAGRL